MFKTFLQRKKIIIFLLCFFAVSFVVIGFVFASKKYYLVKGVAVIFQLGQNKDDKIRNKTETNVDKENSFLSPTNKPTFVDCVGPDGKIAHVIQEDCDNLVNFWKNHPSLTPSNGNSSNNSSNSNNSGNTPTPSIPNIVSLSWLKTNGNKIVRADNNQEIVFHGMNSSGMEWGAGNQWNQNGVSGCQGNKNGNQYGCWDVPPVGEYDNLQNWGFNIVRLPISWANLEPVRPIGDPSDPSFHQYNENYLKALDDVINQFQAHNIQVIISMHQWDWSPVFAYDGMHGLGMPVWLYDQRSDLTKSQAEGEFFNNSYNIVSNYKIQKGYIDALKEIAIRYKDNKTVVGIDMFNEPPGYVDLKSFYEKIANAIIPINPNLLLVFQDAVNAPNILPANKPDISNSIYSFHTYPNSFAGNQPKIDGHLNKANGWNIPLWIGEFAYVGDKGTIDSNTDAQSQTKQWLQYCKDHNISWTYWAYQKADKAIAGGSGKDNPDMNLVNILEGGF